jgi:hypothetical protein
LTAFRVAFFAGRLARTAFFFVDFFAGGIRIPSVADLLLRAAES